jgi:hypothetical protein
VFRDVRVAELREVLERHKVKLTPALYADGLHKMGVFVPAARTDAATGATAADVVELVKKVRAAKQTRWRRSRPASRRPGAGPRPRGARPSRGRRRPGNGTGRARPW